MRKISVICVTILACLVAATGCSVTVVHAQRSQTPTGLPCTEFHESSLNTTVANSCLYYFNNNVATACGTSAATDYCPATKGAYYSYGLKDGKTFKCTIHNSCGSANNAVITDPTLLCPRQIWSYNSLVNLQTAWRVVDEVHDQNNTPSAAEVTFTSTKSSTVTVGTSTDVTQYTELDLKVITASVQREVNSSVVNSSTAVIGNSYTVTAPAGRTVFGIYGVQVQMTAGHLYATEAYSGDPCTSLKQDLGTVTTTVPIGPGWCVWLDNQSPSLCPIAES